VLWMAVGLIGLALLLASVAFHYLVTEVRVVNESSVTLTEVQVTMAGKEIWSGPIAAGERRTLYGLPSNDGTIGISFEASGQSAHTEFGYVTPGAAENYKVVVLPSLEVHIVDCELNPSCK
jgi:hypothetical protein